MTGVKYVMMQSAPEMKNTLKILHKIQTLRSYKTCLTRHIFWTSQYV